MKKTTCANFLSMIAFLTIILFTYYNRLDDWVEGGFQGLKWLLQLSSSKHARDWILLAEWFFANPTVRRPSRQTTGISRSEFAGALLRKEKDIFCSPQFRPTRVRGYERPSWVFLGSCRHDSNTLFLEKYLVYSWVACMSRKISTRTQPPRINVQMTIIQSWFQFPTRRVHDESTTMYRIHFCLRVQMTIQYIFVTWYSHGQAEHLGNDGGAEFN